MRKSKAPRLLVLPRGFALQLMVRRYMKFIPRRPQSPDRCWRWTGSLSARTGAGRFRVNGRTALGVELAHRVAYAMATDGVIYDGTRIEHLPTCHHADCVRPSHLTAVPGGAGGRSGRLRAA
jgi:hypothetical protein